PLEMVGWLVALVYNAVADFAAALEGDYAGEFVSTLRRQFFNRPGRLYGTPEALLVYLDPFRGQEALEPVVDRFNAAGHRLPWLEGRRVVLSLTPRPQPQGGRTSAGCWITTCAGRAWPDRYKHSLTPLSGRTDDAGQGAIATGGSVGGGPRS